MKRTQEEIRNAIADLERRIPKLGKGEQLIYRAKVSTLKWVLYD